MWNDGSGARVFQGTGSLGFEEFGGVGGGGLHFFNVIEPLPHHSLFSQDFFVPLIKERSIYHIFLVQSRAAWRNVTQRWDPYNSKVVHTVCEGTCGDRQPPTECDQ